MDKKILKQYVRALEQMTNFFKTLIEEENKRYPIPATEENRVAELTDLRFLSRSDKWPLAVPQDTICEDEECKMARADAIIQDFIKTDLDDKRLLDFGCGEGHVPYLAAQNPGIIAATGYDLVEPNPLKHEKLTLTTDWETVKKNGPYDIIVLNDVLDHAEDMHDVMRKCVEIKSKFGKIFARCHPWTSRHGTHLYKQLNKAYLHLVFTPEELYAMGYKEMRTRVLLNPMKTYQDVIKEAGLTIMEQEIIQQPIEMFFTTKPALLRRIKERFAKSDDPEYASGKFPREILEIQFVDFTLL